MNRHTQSLFLLLGGFLLGWVACLTRVAFWPESFISERARIRQPVEVLEFRFDAREHIGILGAPQAEKVPAPEDCPGEMDRIK